MTKIIFTICEKYKNKSYVWSYGEAGLSSRFRIRSVHTRPNLVITASKCEFYIALPNRNINLQPATGLLGEKYN